MSNTFRHDAARARGGFSFAAVACLLALVCKSANASIAFTPGELLVLDSNASAGNGQLFSVDRSTGVATAIGSGFADEPWTMVLQSPTTLLAADSTDTKIYRLDLTTGNWTNIITSPILLQYPNGAMIADTPDSVLVASGGGKIYRVNTDTGQQSLFADYSDQGTHDAWGMTRLPDGSIVLSDAGTGRIVRVDSNGVSTLVAAGGSLISTWGIAALDNNNVAVGTANGVGRGGIVNVNLTTGAVTPITASNAFYQAIGITLESDGDLLVTDEQSTVRGALYEVNPSTGNVALVSNDPKFANPTATLIVPVPEPASISVLLITAHFGYLGRRRRRDVRE